MDMFSSGFAAPWSLERVAAWRRHAGEGGLFMVQTHTLVRAGLVQEFINGSIGGSWQSRSAWNSSRLLPEFVCLHKGRRHRCDCSAPAREGAAAAAWLREVAACDSAAGRRATSGLCGEEAAQVYSELFGTYASIPLPPEASNETCGSAVPVRHLGLSLSDSFSYDCCV
uniref:Uncharacterized protein n=1 Tax=Alexandrium catenella TaxID=2925 RepID=A0A7S1RZI8_ALECA